MLLIFKAILAVLILASLITYFFSKKVEPVTLENMINNLADLGIALNPGISIDTLLESHNREEYEISGYKLLLIRYGGEIEREPFTSISNYFWHFDTEAIENHGDYSRIAVNFMRISNGDLPLSDIHDYVDIAGAKAWLEFKLNGEQYHWDAKIDNDWVDLNIIINFAKLMTGLKTGKRFISANFGGQDLLFGYASDELLVELNKLANIHFIWLE